MAKERDLRREREYMSRFNIIFAFHSGHSQGWVWFYTEGFQCGVFIRQKQKTKPVCKCVYFVGLVCVCVCVGGC